MHHQEFEPPEALRDTIKCFWYNCRDVGREPSSFDVMPDGYAEIVFHFGGACSMFRDGAWQPLPSPSLMGLLNRPVQLRTTNRLEIIGIRCFPWTVFDLLGLPSAKDGAHIVAHPIAGLHTGLDASIRAGKIADALDQITRYLLHARSQIAANTMLFKAGGAMREAGGTLPVAQVAVAAHATVRTLERKFKQSSGHTVKDVSALIRFEQVRNRLWLHPDTDLAGLAHELGYTDQSHLSREFKRYSGTTPAAFARKTRSAKRAVGDDIVAFIQA